MPTCGGVTFALFVEGVHGWPGERDPYLQLVRVRGEIDVLLCPSRRTWLTHPNGAPGCEPKIRMAAPMLRALENLWRDLGLREIGHRIVDWFEEQENVLVGDPDSAEAHTHRPAQRRNIQQSLG